LIEETEEFPHNIVSTSVASLPCQQRVPDTMDGNSPSNILSKLTSPTAVKAAIAECDRLSCETFLREYGYKPAREYKLRVGDSEYDSKAIAAVAFGYQHGTRPLLPNECSGGRDRGNAAWTLDRLGFCVSGINHEGWWVEEVELTVDAYLDMLALHRAGVPFTKSSYLKKLHAHGPARTLKAYEFKMQNISAALSEMGKGWLLGYAPKARYQHLVRFVLEDRLGRAADPAKIELPQVQALEHASRFVKIDWAKRDAENRELGRGGEKFVLEHERARLAAADKPELAAKVTWKASEADGHGYDISSFESDGTPIHIEVKTTTRGELTPFFVSSNEVRVSERLGMRYRLYRVFNFPRSPEIATYRGSLSACLRLSPASYRAQRK